MTSKRGLILKGLLLVVALVAVAGIGTALNQKNKDQAMAEVPDIEYEWAAPTTGTLVSHYVAQVMVNERDTLYLDAIPTESLLVPAQAGNLYTIRVAGVDNEGIQGPWSSWSPSFIAEPENPDF